MAQALARWVESTQASRNSRPWSQARVGGGGDPHRAHGPTCTLIPAVETVSNKHGYLHWVVADFHNRLRIHGAIPVPNLNMVLQTSAPVKVAIRTEFPHRLFGATSIVARLLSVGVTIGTSWFW